VNQPPEHRTLPWLTASDEVLLRIQKQLEHLVSVRLPTPMAAWMPQPEVLRSFVEVAFWASLRSNEERPTRVRVALAPQDLVPGAFAFASSVDCSDSQVAKLAHVVPSYGSLLVAPGNDRLQIWGFTTALPGGGIDGITAEIDGPGIVRVNIHILRPYAVFMGGKVFFLEGGAPVNLPDYLRKAMRKQLSANDIVQLHQGWHECIVLGVLARMIVDQGHGGTILVVPDIGGSWSDSIDPFAFRFATPDSTAREWIQQRLTDNQSHGGAFARIWSSSLSQEDKVLLTAALSSRPWQPRDAVQHIAPLAHCDGAIVMTQDLRVVGFGAKILTRGETPSMLCRFDPIPGPRRSCQEVCK
jgi:Probable sensor domain DACNV